MKIENLKDLEAIIKLCRRQGIDSIKVDGVELNLGAPPQTKRRGKDEPFRNETGPTEEELLFWSSQGA